MDSKPENSVLSVSNLLFGFIGFMENNIPALGRYKLTYTGMECHDMQLTLDWFKKCICECITCVYANANICYFICRERKQMEKMLAAGKS